MKNLLYHCEESYVSGKILCMCLRGFVRRKQTNGEPEWNKLYKYHWVYLARCLGIFGFALDAILLTKNYIESY